MTALPYPTPTRLVLADAIAAGDVTAAITARTAELAAAGLVEVTVRLTPDGMAWVTRARTREPVSEEAMDAALVVLFNDLAENGPVSTSPETGPGACRRVEWCVLPDDGHNAWECMTAQSTKDGGCTGICDSEPEGQHAYDCPNREA